MDSKYWINRWEQNNIRFHNEVPNPALVKHFAKMGLGPGQRIFIPLCGKTLDIGWLMAQGHHVIGAELSELAIQQLFAEANITPKIKDLGKAKLYSEKQIDIFVGDIFALTKEDLGPIDAVYDRAALIALPPDMRRKYTSHLQRITDSAPQLLLSFEYDQSAMEGPPFSVPAAEVKEHYQSRFNITLLEKTIVPDGLRGLGPATECVWWLR